MAEEWLRLEVRILELFLIMFYPYFKSFMAFRTLMQVRNFQDDRGLYGPSGDEQR